MKIRNASTQDLPAILTIVNHAIKTSTAVYDYHERSIAQITAWYTKKLEDHLPILVAEENNTTIAYGSYGIFRPWDGFMHTVEHSIYVAELHQKKGIGKLLLQALIEKAKQQNFHCMVAGIDAENTKSILLHEKFGFEKTGHLKEVGRKFDRWLDLVFMQKIL
ncbi:GNAT family N-acetyltransferase [Zhouia sp. PK063]|uniref:GNAT family N-acetyltransferase n=1 Tax=Zhouia sp. PK063 TaxID=3373602 RepID=UPI0037B2132D